LIAVFFLANSSSYSQEPLPEPCQISADRVAEIIGCEDHMEARPNGMNSEESQDSDYQTNMSGSLGLLFQRHEVRNPEAEDLQNACKSELEIESTTFTYQDISDELGDQAIYSYGKKGCIAFITSTGDSKITPKRPWI